MSSTRRNHAARQSLVPILGFIALSLFVINFFTFLSGFFAPNRCTARVQTEQVETRVVEIPSIHTRIVARRQLEADVRRIEAEVRRAERKLRCAERAARRAEATARLHEAHAREISVRLDQNAYDLRVHDPSVHDLNAHAPNVVVLQ